MDTLHLTGVQFIQWAQDRFKAHDELMLFLSHLGDPRNAFLIYFPLTYFCQRSSGVKVIWTGILAEWLNAVFKWMLFGERPYWWVFTTDLYQDSRPDLHQYRLTCETGPGSPSGHGMVTAAVLYVMIRCLLTHKLHTSSNRSVYSVLLWCMYALVMGLVCFSRCYIAAHFPHQVIAGVLVGMVLGECVIRWGTDQLKLAAYSATCLVILLTGPAIYSLLQLMGYDPMWTVELATRWCAKREWVYLDTTLFFAITRDASVLLGVGAGLWLQDKYIKSPPAGATRTIIHIVVSILFTRGMEYVPISQDNRTLFYSLAFIKYMLLFVVVVAGVNAICAIVLPKETREDKKR